MCAMESMPREGGREGRVHAREAGGGHAWSPTADVIGAKVVRPTGGGDRPWQRGSAMVAAPTGSRCRRQLPPPDWIGRCGLIAF